MIDLSNIKATSFIDGINSLKKEFDLDESNAVYFYFLLQKKLSAKKQKPLVVGLEPSVPPGELKNYRHFVPASILSEEEYGSIPVTDYATVLKNKSFFSQEARSLSVRIQKLLAGRGTSFSRERFRKFKLGAECPPSSSKGLDLIVSYVKEGKSALLSVAELQILQSLKCAQKEKYSSVEFQPLLGPDTSDFKEQILAKPYPFQLNTSFGEFCDEQNNFGFVDSEIQSYIPTLDDESKLRDDYTAPGGHGYFAFSLIQRLLTQKVPPAENQIYSVSNGEDINSSPPPHVFGWMHSVNCPFVMITTEKTEHDLKGGQISLVIEDDESYISILERAQAEQADEVLLFEQLGLRTNDRKALFNTNTAMFSLRDIFDRLKALQETLSDEEILHAIAPDLIENKKTISFDVGKAARTQLEGAMGSVILNFDRLCRKFLNKKSVHFLNVDRLNRSHFFTPVKSAVDYSLLFQSDLFSMNEDFRLIPARPGHAISFDIDFNRDDWNIKDLLTVWQFFDGSKISQLDSLKVRGPVFMKGLTLIGRVELENLHHHALDVNDFIKGNIPVILSNVRIKKDSKGLLRTEKI